MTTIKPVDPKIEDYIFSLTNREDNSILLAMEKYAQEKKFPIVGRLVGISLRLLAKSINAKRVFEFGSGFGYSAYWFGQAVGGDGKVYLTDGDADNEVLAKEFLLKTGLWPRLEYKIGHAQESFAQLQGDFDVIYNDADKHQYPEIWQMAKKRLRPGGLYIADNTLWSGRVVHKTVADEPYPGTTAAIKEHNLLVAGDNDFDFFLNPTRDGVIVARKK